MFKKIGPQILIADEKALLLEVSTELYKNYPSLLFFRDSKLDLVIDWPDLVSLMNALVNDDMVVAERLYFAHRQEIAGQLYNEKSGHGTHRERYVSECWSENILVSQIVLEMTEKGLDSVRIGMILNKFIYYTTTLIRLGNLEITRVYLTMRTPEKIFLDCESIFGSLVKKVDLKHLELFLQHRPETFNGAYYLFEPIISNIRNLHAHEAGRAFIKTPLQFKLFDKIALEDLECILMLAKREDLEIFMEYGYRSIFKCQLDGKDIIACLFGNRDPEVLQMLKNMKINLDARGSYNRTSLHFAAQKNATDSIRFLLSRGIDPNALDNSGNTPLQLGSLNCSIYGAIWDAECVKELLIGGTDLLRGYWSNGKKPIFFGIHIFDLRQNNCLYSNVMNLLLAQLAVCEALGLSVEKPMNDYRMFQRYGYGDNLYDKCKEQLAQLKNHKFRKSPEFWENKFNMFALLSQRTERFAWCLNEDDRNMIAKFMEKYKKENLLMPLYYETLESHIKIINQISASIMATKCVLTECMGIENNNHLVINEIVNYLTVRDFLT